MQSSCKHPHRCNQMRFCCVYFLIERKARSIYLHIHPNTAQQLQVRSTGFEALKRCLLLNCIQGELNYSLALQCHWSNRSIAGSYIRPHKIKRLIDNNNICRLFFIVDVVNNVD